MSRDTSLRERPRRRYSFSQYGQSEQGHRQGNHLILNNQADIWSPAYGAGVTTIRLFPGKDPENPEAWDPYRFSSSDPFEPLGFGDWIRRYPAVRSMGDPPVTFIQYDPADTDIEDPQMTPAWLLYRAIDRAVQNGQDRPGWAALLRGGANRGAQLTRPSEVYLVRGALVQFKSRAYATPRGLAPDEKPIVFELGPSPGGALLTELHRENEGYQGDPDDFEARYVNGDPIRLDGGRFVNFYTLKDGDPRQAQASQQAGWDLGGNRGRSGGAGGQQQPIGFGCYMEPSFNGIPANVFANYEQIIRTKIVPWDQLLYIPTLEQQARLLADKFPADVIEYAWASHPEWIPDEVRRRARNAISAAAPNIDFPGTNPHDYYRQNTEVPSAPALHQQPGQQVGGMLNFAAPPQTAIPSAPNWGGGQQPMPQQPMPQQPMPQQPQPQWQTPQSSHTAAPTMPPMPNWGAPQQPLPPPQQPQQQMPQQPMPQPPQGNVQAPPMSWATQPNPVATQPPSVAPPGSIPPAPVGNSSGNDISPPEQPPFEPGPGTSFDQPAAQPAQMSAAQAALARAQAARQAGA
jgi:hypothetical protein